MGTQFLEKGTLIPEWETRFPERGTMVPEWGIQFPKRGTWFGDDLSQETESTFRKLLGILTGN